MVNAVAAGGWKGLCWQGAMIEVVIWAAEAARVVELSATVEMVAKGVLAEERAPEERVPAVEAALVAVGLVVEASVEVAVVDLAPVTEWVAAVVLGSGSKEVDRRAVDETEMAKAAKEVD